MTKKEISPLAVIGVIVVLLGFVGYIGVKAMNPPEPRAGSYTPGAPPWMDKNSPSYHQQVSVPPPPGTQGG